MPRHESRPDAAPPGNALFAGARAVFIALVVIALLFLAYDVLEPLWLFRMTMPQLHALSEARAIVASALAASIAAWLVLRAPPLFPELQPAEAAGSPQALASALERERRFAAWFVQMRWIAVVVAVVLIVVSVQVTAYLEADLLRPLLLATAVLALMNVVYGVGLRWQAFTHWLLLIQAYGDLLVLTALLHFSGGVENPLGILMVFHVLIAGIVLSPRQCYLVATGGSLLFAALAAGELWRVLPHYTLTLFPHVVEGSGPLHAALTGEFVASRIGLQVIVLFLTGYFTSTITAQLRRRDRQLEALAGEALAQSQLLERSLDTTGTALCVRGADLKPTWANPRWGEFFGEGDDTGPAALGELHARDTLKDGSVNVGEVALPADRPGSAQEGGSTASTDRRTILLTTAPLLDKQGTITHVVELARDVTELRRIQERIGRAEQLAAVGELAGKVVHEVNNPIAVISAKARLLLSRNRAELTEHTAAELVKITDLADKVAHIARGLLSYARPSPGIAAPADIRGPVGRALSLIEPAARAAGVEVVDRLPTSLPPVRVNAVEMERVFLNLFMNALDAMPNGGQLAVGATIEGGSGREAREGGPDGLPRTAGALAGRPGAQLTVIVEDTGVGIPRELQQHVFEPFVTTKPEGKGTGLGLAVCVGLVRSHGGGIDLESQPGHGTRVYVRLPLSGSPLAEVRGNA